MQLNVGSFSSRDYMTTIPACRAGWSHEHHQSDHMDLSSVCIPLLRSCLQPLSNGTLESCFLNRHAIANVSRGFVNDATHKGNKYGRRPRHQKCERDKRTLTEQRINMLNGQRYLYARIYVFQKEGG